MANLLIGSSNLNRHYRSTDFPNFRKYEMVKCTQLEGFKVFMENIDTSRKSVLISVFENFVVDAVGADITSPESLIDDCVKDFLSTILSSATRLPGTRFAIVMPLQRPALGWYQDRVESITSFLEEGIKAMIMDKNTNNVARIDCVSATSQLFESDKIHLTKASAKTFLEVILDLAETFYRAPIVDLTEQGEVFDSDVDAHVARLEARLERLERTLKQQLDKNIGNDLMFARVREEVDAGTNKSKEDRIVINGLSAATPLPSDQKQRIEALKGIVHDIFKSIIPDFKGKIVYLSQGKNQTTPLPMVEVKIDKVEYAVEMRKAFAEKKKKNLLGASHSALFMANSVNLATRIRVDIMKAIARRLTHKDEIAYVAGFTSRPTMHIRKTGADNMKPLKSFLFIDSVSRFGNMLERKELETAYGRAGRSFNGQLRQNFVVLNEYDQDALMSVDPNRAGTSGYGGPQRSQRGGGGGTGGARGQWSGRAKGTKRAGDNLESAKSKK